MGRSMPRKTFPSMSDTFEWKRTGYGQAGTGLEKRELHGMME
jgi:hypothetical protein